MKTVRYEEKTAKRDHKRRCDMSGALIKKGDRYFESFTVDGRDSWYFKGHAILADIAQGEISSGYDSGEGWDPWCMAEYLGGFLNRHLGKDLEWEDLTGWAYDSEVQSCLDSAAEYWRTH